MTHGETIARIHTTADGTGSELDLVHATVVEEVAAIQDGDLQILELHQALAARLGGDALLERALLDALWAREQAERRLGSAVRRWLALGGGLVLDDPAVHATRSDAPAPETVEVVTTDGDVHTVDEAQPEAQAPVTSAPEETATESVPEPVPDVVAPAPPSVTPAGPPASRGDLERLCTIGVGGAAPSPVPAVSRATTWIEAMVAVTADPLLGSARGRLDEIGELVRRINDLVAAAREDQVAVLGLITCRLRALQERAEGARLRDRIDRIMPTLTTFSRIHRPGFVHGLAREHTVEGGDWDGLADGHLAALGLAPPAAMPVVNPEDLLGALDALLKGGAADADLRDAVVTTLEQVRDDDPRLLRLLEGKRSALRGDGRLKKLRRALSERETPVVAAPVVDGDRPSEDWPLWSLWRGKRVLLVGNKPNPEASERLRRAFDAAEVHWLVVDPRRVAAAEASIRSGSWDICLFTRFRGHDSELLVWACEESGVRWVRLQKGYGVSAVRDEVDRRWR